jgi:hypothetical protein
MLKSLISGFRALEESLPLAALLPLAVTMLGSGCADAGTGPRDAPGLSIVAGANGRDTVDARLAQALVVELRDETRAVVPGAVVRFTCLPVRSGEGWTIPGVTVGKLGARFLDQLVVDTTDGDGRAAVLVGLGVFAGDASIEIAVPALGLADTAHFTVQPGRSDSIVVTPSDSALYVGHSYTVTAQAIDRYANATGAAVHLAGPNGSVASVAGNSVTGHAYGRAAIVATASGVSDTAWTSVVPAGTVAGARYPPAGWVIALIQFDGSGYAQIPNPHTFSGANLTWAPDGSYLVGAFDDPKTLYRFTTAGSANRVLASTASVGDITAVDISADGRWIYFSAGNCNYNAIIYRVAVGDSVPQRISATTGNDCFDLVHARVSLAPDGARAVVEHYAVAGGIPDLQVVNLAYGTSTSLGVSGYTPKWSPLGDRIAYVFEGHVWTVHPDGSGAAAISPLDRIFQAGLDWSPDGAWLLARYQPISWNDTAGWVLLRVATHEMLPLPTTLAGFTAPTWDPAP